MAEDATKCCTKCSINKPATTDFFYAHKKSGLSSECKVCVAERGKAWREGNKALKASRDKEYAEANREKLKAFQKEYRQKNKAKASAYLKEYTRIKGKELAEKKREYHQRPEAKAKRREYMREVRKNNPKKRLMLAVRSCVSGMVSGKIGATRYLPYNAETLCKHLEKQFSRGMNWGNYGEWHVDHITPCVRFNMSGKPDCPEFQACWALSNLRPLWASENMSKQDKITHLI